jgi:hypothetical protein
MHANRDMKRKIGRRGKDLSDWLFNFSSFSIEEFNNLFIDRQIIQKNI